MSFLDRTFSGESMSFHQIMAIFIPILVDQAFLVILTLVNTAMISSSGMAAVSAVSMVDSLNLFLLNVFIAIATGGTVVVAQYKGVGNSEMVSKSAAQAISAVTLLSAVVAALMILFHIPILNVLFGDAEAAVMHNAQIYIIGSCLSYPFIAIVEVVCGVLRGASETKPSLFLSVVMNMSYVLLNLVLVTALDWGVMGLSISLVVSRLLASAVSILYLLFKDRALAFSLKEALHFDFPIQKKILFVGVPFAAEQMFFNGGKILTQTFIVQLGTLSISVNAICNSLVPLIQIPANALNLAVITVVGQCMGRRDVKDARKFIRAFLLMSSLSFLICAILFLPFFQPLVSLFHPPAEIIPDIWLITLIYCIGAPIFWSISFITPSALRAAGDSKYTSIISLLSMWLFRVVLGYVLGVVLDFGIVGVWAAMILEWGVRGLIFLLRLKGDKWYAHHLIDD